MRRAGLVSLALVTLAALPAPRAAAALPGTNGSIAYQSGVTGSDYEILVNSQFGGTTQLTNNDVQDFSPAYSPDGAKIAFSRRDGMGSTDEIYLMDSSGNNLVQLTKNAVDDGEPAWSPNGKRLVFTRTTTTGSDLFAMDAKDSNHDGRGDHQVRLTKHKGNHSIGNPAWSPNGKRIAFSRFVAPANYEIFTMKAAPLSRRNRAKRLTSDPAPNAYLDSNPDWSPDGTKIVFETNRFGHFDIAVMNSDGSGITPLTNDATTDGTPVFSPDGTEIAYYRAVSGGGDIFVMDATGSSPPGTNQTSTAASDTDPTWQPVVS